MEVLAHVLVYLLGGEDRLWSIDDRQAQDHLRLNRVGVPKQLPVEQRGAALKAIVLPTEDDSDYDSDASSSSSGSSLVDD